MIADKTLTKEQHRYNSQIQFRVNFNITILNNSAAEFAALFTPKT